MKKSFYLYSSIFLLMIAASCRPARKVQRLEEAISKRDTSQTVIVPAKVVDSFKLVKDIVANINKVQHIDFNTFSAKIKVDYEGKDESDQVTVYLRMKKDSIIWVSVRGALGIEGARLLIDHKHVKLMNMLNHSVQFRNVSYLQEITHVPLDFEQLQNFLIGNPVYIDSNNIVSYKSTQNQLLILMIGKIFKNLLTLNKSSLLVQHSKLDDVDPMQNRTCDLTYDNYEKVKNFSFPTSRKISVAEQSKLDIDLQFKQYNFDEPQTFPFNIPKNYKVL